MASSLIWRSISNVNLLLKTHSIAVFFFLLPYCSQASTSLLSASCIICIPSILLLKLKSALYSKLVMGLHNLRLPAYFGIIVFTP